MLIRRIKIENYRSIQCADFTPSTLCALIGGNNCGKSNVLKAINLVLGDRWPSVRTIEEWDFHGYDEDRDLCVWFNDTRLARSDVGDPSEFTSIQFKATRYKRNAGAHRKGDKFSAALWRSKAIPATGQSVGRDSLWSSRSDGRR